MRLHGRGRSSKPLPIHISDWVHDYWLASSDQIADLVPVDPLAQDTIPRHDDRHRIRWLLVADLAVDLLLEARRRVGPNISLPAEGLNRGLEFDFRPPVALTVDEQFILVSFFSEPAVADIGNGDVTNGRHRLYACHLYGAQRVPVQSSILSGWTWEHFGDPDCRQGDYPIDFLYDLRDRHQQWARGDPDADTAFMLGVDVALRYSTPDPGCTDAAP